MNSSRRTFRLFKFRPDPPDNPKVAETFEQLESGLQQGQVTSNLILAGMHPSEAEAIVEEASAFGRSLRKQKGIRTYIKGILFALLGFGAILVMWYLGSYGGRLLLASAAMIAAGSGYAVYGLRRTIANTEIGESRKKLAWGLPSGIALIAIAMALTYSQTVGSSLQSDLAASEEVPDNSYISFEVYPLETDSDGNLTGEPVLEGHFENAHAEWSIQHVGVAVKLYAWSDYGILRQPSPISFKTLYITPTPARIGPGEKGHFSVTDPYGIPAAARYEADAEWEWVPPKQGRLRPQGQ